MERSLVIPPQPLHRRHQSHIELKSFNAGVHAGFPSPAADTGYRRIDLTAELVPRPESSFQFQVKGDSMTGVGVYDSDRIVVDKSIEPQHNHIVLAVIDGEFTVKRLYKRGGVIRLLAENPAYPPIELKDGQELIIWGVVTYNLRKLF